MGHFVFWGFLPIISQLLSDVGRSADFPVRRKLLSHDRAANWVQVGVRTMLRTGKSALRDLRPRSLTGYEGRSPPVANFHQGKYAVLPLNLAEPFLIHIAIVQLLVDPGKM